MNKENQKDIEIINEKTGIFFNTLPIDISFGCNFCNRLVLVDYNTIFFANKSSIYIIQLNFNTNSSKFLYTKNVKVPFPQKCENSNYFECYNSSNDKNTEFIDLAISKSQIGAIDTSGNCEIFRICPLSEITKCFIDEKNEESVHTVKKRKVNPKLPIEKQYSITQDKDFFEYGCGGISFHPEDDNKVFVRNYFSKNVKRFNNGKLDNTYYLQSNPTKVKVFQIPQSDNCLTGIIESSQILILDDRMRNEISIVNQHVSSPFYDFDFKGNCMAGVCNRDLFLYDIRKWKFRKRFSNLLKCSPISYIKFSESKSLIYTSGNNELNILDYEKKKKTGRKNSVFFNSQIVGFDKWKNDNDTICSVSDSSDVFFLENLYKIM